jgi:hypothetical protein
VNVKNAASIAWIVNVIGVKQKKGNNNFLTLSMKNFHLEKTEQYIAVNAKTNQ